MQEGAAAQQTVGIGGVGGLREPAASVVAKVTRDAIMTAEAENFPPYGFEGNKGYAAPVHQMALAGYGPTTIHRRSWSFMDDIPWRDLLPPPGRLL